MINPLIDPSDSSVCEITSSNTLCSAVAAAQESIRRSRVLFSFPLVSHRDQAEEVSLLPHGWFPKASMSLL